MAKLFELNIWTNYFFFLSFLFFIYYLWRWILKGHVYRLWKLRSNLSRPVQSLHNCSCRHAWQHRTYTSSALVKNCLSGSGPYCYFTIVARCTTFWVSWVHAKVEPKNCSYFLTQWHFIKKLCPSLCIRFWTKRGKDINTKSKTKSSSLCLVGFSTLGLHNFRKSS